MRTPSPSRRALLAVALAVAAGPLAACGSGRGEQAGNTPSDPAGSATAGTTSPAPGVPAGTAAAGAAAVQDAGAALFRAAATAAPGDLALSPLSVHLALAMTALGARGATAREFAAVLHAPDAGRQARDLNALVAHLRGLARPVPIGDGETFQPRFDLADALWGQRGLPWSAPYLAALSTGFGAALRQADFTTAADAARREINAWVAGTTHDTVPELLPAGAVTADSRLVLVNALYLKARWQQTFTRTAPGDFTRGDGRRVQAQLMHLEAPVRYGTGPGWQAVQLRYLAPGGGTEPFPGYAMTLVLPDPGRMPDLVAGLDGARLRHVLAAPAPAALTLTVPRWRTRTAVALADVLAGLGLRTAFTRDADFSGMTTSPQGLAIDAVRHQGYVSVDENGTEASAATSVEMGMSGVIPQREVTFDRPFLYVIHDVPTATPLFLGRVDDPSAA